MSDQRTTPDQQRAKHAWDVITRIKPKDSKDEKAMKRVKEFGNQARKLPMRILASGLGGALAFLEAKLAPKKQSDRALFDIVDQLPRALADRVNQIKPAAKDATTRLVVRIIEGDTEFLRLATSECLAYLQWLVRFAEAEGFTE